MRKRAFLIHGWGGYPEEGWRPWLKEELEQRNFQVFVPAMPETDHPRQEAWITHLKKVIGKPDENCYFVGHSLGVIAILRYLETLQKGVVVGGIVSIAGFAKDLGEKEHATFFAAPLKFGEIKPHILNFVTIQSDNDPWISLNQAKFLQEKFDGKLLLVQNMKHFSGGDGITKLPEVLAALLEIVNKKK